MDDPNEPARELKRLCDEHARRIVVIGTPTRYVMPLVLEPVGQEWDGTIKPLGGMTYDPPKGATDGN
ncbi:MAG TPA: hypothetical protein VD866_17880 [Urbifossiella sp.]|nr:hypothetical protein [Urbifossiella sp.]